jgi:hypothetical protein
VCNRSYARVNVSWKTSSASWDGRRNAWVIA